MAHPLIYFFLLLLGPSKYLPTQLKQHAGPQHRVRHRRPLLRDHHPPLRLRHAPLRPLGRLHPQAQEQCPPFNTHRRHHPRPRQHGHGRLPRAVDVRLGGYAVRSADCGAWACAGVGGSDGCLSGRSCAQIWARPSDGANAGSLLASRWFLDLPVVLGILDLPTRHLHQQRLHRRPGRRRKRALRLGKGHHRHRALGRRFCAGDDCRLAQVLLEVRQSQAPAGRDYQPRALGVVTAAKLLWRDPVTSRQALLSGAASPVFTFLIIMFATGIPLAEKPTQRRAFLASTGDHSASSGSGGSDGQELLAYQNQHESDPWLRYKAFRERTSLLIPIPPALYHHLPGFVKQSVLLDRPIYRFDETRDGSRAIQEAREKKEQLV